MRGSSERPASKRAGQVLRDARLRAAKTQEDASAVHSTSTISRWETGKHAPSWDDLDAYAHELGQTIRLLFGPDIEVEAAPDWERLMRTVDAIADRVGVTLEERVASAAVDAELLERSGAETPAGQEADGLAGAVPSDERGR